MNRALARTHLVADGGPPRCPDCAGPLSFECDRQGRTVESCGCGHRGYVLVREGKHGNEPAGSNATVP